MPRDYKRRRSSKKRQDAPGWVWGLGGLAIGLSVAAFVYLKGRGDVTPSVPAPDPAAIPSSAREIPEQPDVEPKSRFDFYDMLPRFEVVIPETESEISSAEHAGSNFDATEVSSYVLQAGSFQNFRDADRMKAQLALLGMESQIQNVTIDDRRWHRVRLGPFTDFTEAQRVRRRLRESDIDALILRLAN